MYKSVQLLPDLRARGAAVKFDGVCPLQEGAHCPNSGVFALRNYADLRNFLFIVETIGNLKNVFSAAEIMKLIVYK